MYTTKFLKRDSMQFNTPLPYLQFNTPLLLVVLTLQITPAFPKSCHMLVMVKSPTSFAAQC